MKLPKLIKDQIHIELEEDGQITAQVFPNKKPPLVNGVDCSEIDIIRLQLNSIEGKVKELYMTPDEALAISATLTTAVNAYLMFSSKGYRDEILKKRVRIATAREQKLDLLNPNKERL